MQSRLALFVLLAVLASATHAHAWGREGHVIVAEIAQHHLTPEARTAVQELLDPEPDPKHRTLARASTWPDRIKSPKHPQHRQYAFARKLHYVNSPPDADGYDRGRDCPEGKCVVEAIHTYRTLLRDATDPQMRQPSACWHSAGSRWRDTVDSDGVANPSPPAHPRAPRGITFPIS